MEANKQQPDHSGLQAVEPTEAPEVVESTRLRGPLERRSSLNGPEAYTPNRQQERTGQEYYAQAASPLPDAKAHYGSPPGYESEAQRPPAAEPRNKRVCGLKRNVFFIILAVAILVVLAAVLGGVLGSVLTHSKSDSSAKSNSTIFSNGTEYAHTNSGLSLVIPATSSDQLPSYYSYNQNLLGGITEHAYNQDIPEAFSGDVVVANTSVASGSPLAATSWVSNGHTYRQVFWLDGSGNVMTSNTTGTLQPWSLPYNILTNDTAAPNTIALAVCAGTAAENTGLDGIRVYYGSASCPSSNSTQCIREVGMDFFENSAQPVWHMWATFPGSDVASGVSCAASNNVNHLYWRDSGSGTLNQLQWNYTAQYDGSGTSWAITATGPANITSGSDIAAANDGSSTDHIFYQSSGGQINRALYYGSGIEDTVTLETVGTGTKLAAMYANSSAYVVYQKSGEGEMYYDMVLRDGQEIGDGMVGFTDLA